MSDNQKEDGYIREYIVKFEELKRLFGEMSVPTLIDMLIQNTYCAVNKRYKELKQQELTWEQFLTEATVINDEKAWWDSSKRKEDDKGRHLPSSCKNDRKRVKASKKKPRSTLSNCAEEF